MPTLPSLKRDPGSMYAAAIGALHLSPQVQAVLSPVGAQLFSAAYSAAYSAAGPALGSIGSAAINEAISIVGPDVVAAVAGVAGGVVEAIGGAIPMVNMLVSFVQIIQAVVPPARGSSTIEQDCISFWSQQPGSSGPSDPITGNTFTTPSDIFASSTGNINPLRIPNSALGNCLVAITESSGGRADGKDGAEDDAVAPSGSLHSEYGWTQLPHAFNNLFKGAYPNVGVPDSHRGVYRALRFAIASNGPDHGTIPYALYMDLLAGDYDAGRLPVGYIAFLLNSYITKRYLGAPEQNLFVPVLQQSICGGQAPQAMASQIVALIQAWKATRAKINLKHPGMKMRFKLPAYAGEPSAPTTVYYNVFAWSSAGGWQAGRWVEKRELVKAIAGYPYFAIYDAAKRLIAQGSQSEVLAKAASIVYA